MKLKIIILILAFASLQCCKDDDQIIDDGDLSHIDYNPVSYDIPKIVNFPQLEIPADNPMTIDGIQLGRFLFYDPILSADSTMSCSTCHEPEGSFTDNLALSAGIDGIEGKRSSMSLLNVGYYYKGLFWEGRSTTLEEQALLPVEDPVELHNDWPNVINKLNVSEIYPEMFRKAFGISNKSEITKELAAKAIAQFERTLVSSGNSKFDLQAAFKYQFTDLEQEGFDIYFDEDIPGLPDGQCFHCHGGSLLTTNDYFNNGLDNPASLDDFADLGRFTITGNPLDKGRFRTPTLRNIQYTAPYMHDGRFNTLREVIDMYNDGGHGLQNEDENLIAPLNLQESHIEALTAFIETLRDTSFINNPAHKNPFD